MRKYLLPVFAVGIALITSSYLESSKSHDKLSSVRFVYIGNPLIKSHVESRAYWVEDVYFPTSCDEAEEKACSFLVDESHTIGSYPDRELDSWINIRTSQGVTGCYYVTGGDYIYGVVNTTDE